MQAMFILRFRDGRTWATSNASSFSEALALAEAAGMDPKQLAGGERLPLRSAEAEVLAEECLLEQSEEDQS